MPRQKKPGTEARRVARREAEAHATPHDRTVTRSDPLHDGILALWRQRDLVLANPRFSGATDPDVRFGVVYLGARTVSLGELFSAWSRGELRGRCPVCDGDLLLTNAGTGLTFTVASGVCETCGLWSRVVTGPQLRLARVAFAREVGRLVDPRMTRRGRTLELSDPAGPRAADLSIADVVALLVPDGAGLCCHVPGSERLDG